MIRLQSAPLVEIINRQTIQRVAALIDVGIDPHLAVVLVGDNPTSLHYIQIKERAAKQLGIILSLYHLEADAAVTEIEETVRFLAADPEIHGIIVQLPLPDSVPPTQTESILALIPEEKDVDGLRLGWVPAAAACRDTATPGAIPSTLTAPGIFTTTNPVLLPPLVQAVSSLLTYYHLDTAGKQVGVVGRGRLVGQALQTFGNALGIPVTTVDEETPNIFDVTRQADILITGTGEPNLVTYQWVKDGAIVINCANDVHEDSVSQVATALSPARGGIGPLTVAWLFWNTVAAAAAQSRTA